MSVFIEASLLYGIDIGGDVEYLENVAKRLGATLPENDGDWNPDEPHDLAEAITNTLPDCLTLQERGHVDDPSFVISARVEIATTLGCSAKVHELPRPSKRAMEALTAAGCKLGRKPGFLLVIYSDH